MGATYQFRSVKPKVVQEGDWLLIDSVGKDMRVVETPMEVVLKETVNPSRYKFRLRSKGAAKAETQYFPSKDPVRMLCDD